MRIERGEWLMWIDGNTLATAIVGLFGIGGVVYTASSHLKEIAMKSFLDARLDAFLNYESAFSAWSVSKNPADVSLLHQAENVVAMVSSDQTIASIYKVQKIMQSWDRDMDVQALQNAHVEVLFEMHQDLLTFTQPRIVRLKKRQKRLRA